MRFSAITFVAFVSLLASDIDMSAKDNVIGDVVADYEPLSVTAGIGWRF